MKSKTKKVNISPEMLKKGPKIYMMVLLVAVLLIGAGVYCAINKNSLGLNGNVVTEQNSYSDTNDKDYDGKVDSVDDDIDGDGYLNAEDPESESWNVGTRDMLMFATLAYDPAQGKYQIDNGNHDWTTDKKDIDYVCPDVIDNGAFLTGKSTKNCMYDDTKLVGMKATDNQKVAGVVMNKWQTVGKDYYFAGINSKDQYEYYASTDEVKNWAIVDNVNEKVDLVGRMTLKLDATTANSLKTNEKLKEINDDAYLDIITARLDNNFIIAFRGTDFTDLYEWLAADIFQYGLCGYVFGYEDYGYDNVKRIIKKYTDEYKKDCKEFLTKNPGSNKDSEGYPKEPNFYITGHSLGGYLAAAVSARLVQDISVTGTGDEAKYTSEYGAEYLRKVEYFNGIGLDLFRTKSDLISSAIYNLSVSEATKKDKAGKALNNWAIYNAKGEKEKNPKVVCYNIKGDLISALGTHVSQIQFYAAPGAVKRHLTDFGSLAALQVLTRNKFVSLVANGIFKFGNVIARSSRLSKVSDYFKYYSYVYNNKYPDAYNNILDNLTSISFADLLWFGHEPSAGLFYNIKQGTRGKNRLNTTYYESGDNMIITAETSGDESTNKYKWFKNGTVISEEGPTLTINKFDAKDKYGVQVTYGHEQISTYKNGIEEIDEYDKDNVQTLTDDNIFKSKEKPIITIGFKQGGEYVTNTICKLTIGEIREAQIKITNKNGLDSEGIFVKDKIKVLGLNPNFITITSIDDPVFSEDKTTAYINIKFTGNAIKSGAISIPLKSAYDILGNYNNAKNSRTISVTSDPKSPILSYSIDKTSTGLSNKVTLTLTATAKTGLKLKDVTLNKEDVHCKVATVTSVSEPIINSSKKEAVWKVELDTSSYGQEPIIIDAGAISDTSNNLSKELTTTNIIVKNIVSKPTITISSDTWKVVKGKNIILTVTAESESGFKDATINTGNIAVLGLIKKVSPWLVSSPTYSNGGTKATWKVYLSADRAGYQTIRINAGAIMGQNGKTNGGTTSKSIKITNW